MLTHKKTVVPGAAQAIEITGSMDPTLGNPDPVGR